MSDNTLVRYEVDEGVAIITLDDPPANTYTHEMMKQLDAPTKSNTEQKPEGDGLDPAP